MAEPFCGSFAVNEVDSAVDVDAIIVGAPYEDKCEIYPVGTALAPKKIREISTFFSGQSFSEQSIHQLNVLDFGDTREGLSYPDFQNEFSEKIATILRKNALPIILGGDHSIALGTAKGIQNSGMEFDSIVWIDAHLDLMNKYPNGNKFSRATVLRRIIELDNFSTKQVYFIGSRGHNLGWEEIELVNSNKMKVLKANSFSLEDEIENFIKNIITKHKNVYVSVDIDVLDPVFAPGISVPEPGGLTSRELFSIIEKLAKVIGCFEIVEVNPKIDINNLTSMVACKTIFSLLDAI
ncbi:MAG: arginase family protein [Candidatus Heimdallarchaeota archaeon]